MEDRLDRLLAAMEQQRQQIEHLQQQLASVLEENSRLRGLLADTSATRAHTPYSTSPPVPQPTDDPMVDPSMVTDSASTSSTCPESKRARVSGVGPGHGL
jgi:hypothetical protein